MPANEHNVKLTLTAATGLFSGSFVESNAPQPGQRQAKYAGIMVQQLGRGVGHFLLPTQGGADSPILSGAVSIEGGSGEAP